jgi:hypothetical protein
MTIADKPMTLEIFSNRILGLLANNYYSERFIS